VADRTDGRTVAAICALRRVRFSGPELAELLDVPCSTVGAVLERCGMGTLGRLGRAPVERDERRRPGEVIHSDVTKLGRIHGGAGTRITGHKRNPDRRVVDLDGRRRKVIGWDVVRIAIDDATRLAAAEVLSDEQAATAIGFRQRAVAFYARHGVTVERVPTDGCFFYVKEKWP
jgi:Integrase core domain